MSIFFYIYINAIYLRTIFGFNITFEAIVCLIITLGDKWVVKNIKFTNRST